jgi:hypothetical protein
VAQATKAVATGTGDKMRMFGHENQTVLNDAAFQNRSRDCRPQGSMYRRKKTCREALPRPASKRSRARQFFGSDSIPRVPQAST